MLAEEKTTNYLVRRSAPPKQFLKGEETLALSEMFSEEKTWKSR